MYFPTVQITSRERPSSAKFPLMLASQNESHRSQKRYAILPLTGAGQEQVHNLGLFGVACSILVPNRVSKYRRSSDERYTARSWVFFSLNKHPPITSKVLWCRRMRGQCLSPEQIPPTTSHQCPSQSSTTETSSSSSCYSF